MRLTHIKTTENNAETSVMNRFALNRIKSRHALSFMAQKQKVKLKIEFPRQKRRRKEKSYTFN